MTPSELHSRILLHELRTILLDETREGPQIPYKELITKDPHNPASYLILSEELDDQLAELCRIQVELIKEWPLQTEPSPIGLETIVKSDPANHPFYTDHLHARLIGKLVDSKSHWAKLAERRWEITQELYPVKVIQNDYEGAFFKEIPVQPHKLGRTTRMLTDILRYCALNQGKHVLCRANTGLSEAFGKLGHELLDHPPNWFTNHALQYLWDCQVHFGNPDSTGHIRTEIVHRDRELLRSDIGVPLEVEDAFRMIDDTHPWDIAWSINDQAYRGVQMWLPDITFTDHACQLREDWAGRAVTQADYAMDPLNYVQTTPFISQATEDAARQIERNHRLRAIMAKDGRIQYNPKAIIRPENVIPDNQKETHLP